MRGLGSIFFSGPMTIDRQKCSEGRVLDEMKRRCGEIQIQVRGAQETRSPMDERANVV